MKNRISNWIAAVAIGAACGGSALACTSSPQVTYHAAAVSPGSGARAQAADTPVADPSFLGSIVGLWDVKFYDTTGKILEDEAYEIFHSDGTEMMTDTSAPATDNVCVGVYVQTSPTTYRLKHVSFDFDLSGNLIGTATFHTTLVLTANGNGLQGVYTVDVFDTNGNLVFEAAGVVKGTRITPN